MSRQKISHDQFKQSNSFEITKNSKLSSKQNITDWFKGSQPYKCKPKIHFRRRQSKKNWKNSATSLTRDDSPSFTIPKNSRFSSLQQDTQINRKILALNLREELEKGQSFAKSKRKQNWVHHDKMFFPSSTTYFRTSKSNKKKKMRWISKQLGSNPENNQAKVYFATSKLLNLQQAEDDTNNKKGVTIARFENYAKKYLHHGRNMMYDPDLAKHVPGVGEYQVTSPNNSKPAFTMRALTKRFNQQHAQSPGPAAYSSPLKRPHTSQSINQRGTFQRSCRTYLVDPDNGVPGPGAY